MPRDYFFAVVASFFGSSKRLARSKYRIMENPAADIGRPSKNIYRAARSSIEKNY